MEILDLKGYDGKGIWFLGQELMRTLHREGCVASSSGAGKHAHSPLRSFSG